MQCQSPNHLTPATVRVVGETTPVEWIRKLFVFKTMTELEAIIKDVDMSDAMQEDAVKLAAQGIAKFTVEKDIASFVKREFDKKYGQTWYCFAGRSFASYVTYKAKHFMYFYIGDWAVLLFKAH